MNLREQIALAAADDAAAYKSRNALEAVRRAFREYQVRQREAEREEFREFERSLADELAAQWSRDDGETALEDRRRLLSAMGNEAAASRVAGLCDVLYGYAPTGGGKDYDRGCLAANDGGEQLRAAARLYLRRPTVKNKARLCSLIEAHASPMTRTVWVDLLLAHGANLPDDE